MIGGRMGGPIAWMARNSVAANLLMILMLLGGGYMLTKIKKEYLPNIDPDTITVAVALPGATPAEVEQSVVLAFEDALTAVEGIEKMTSEAKEGSGTITLELSGERARNEVYNDVRQAADRVTSLPDDAEEPVVKLNVWRRPVLNLKVHGDTDPMALRMAAEHIRSFLLQQEGISQVEIEDPLDLEIQVEVPEAQLRNHGLTLGQIAETIRRSALDRAGGTIETDGGDLLLRLADRRDALVDFAQIAVVTTPEGTVVRLGEIATLSRGFEDKKQVETFRGKPAIELDVFRVGDQTPITVSDTVHEVLPDALSALPATIDAIILNDRSENYRGRANLLIRNGLIGLSLVLLLLTLFLEVRLAFWVALGIPTAFLGTLLVLPWAGASINLVSMFAFIMALGIVVDDAIVAGENIYEYRQRGMRRLEAAIRGARDIAVPLSFSILTNIVAFIPLALVPGWMGKLWFMVPLVVGLAFLMSWIEALFILPAHLSHGDGRKVRLFGPVRWAAAVLGWIERRIILPVQRVMGGGLNWFTRRIYAWLLALALSWRYVTAAAMIAIFMVTIAYVSSGRMGWGLFPPVPRDYSKAAITMPIGTPHPVTLAARDEVVAAAERVIAANGGDALTIGIHTEVHDRKVSIHVFLTPPEVRPMSTRAFTRAWRRELGTIASARSVRFESSWGGPGGSSIQVRLAHNDSAVLQQAAAELARQLAEFAPVRDIEDGFTPGKTQVEFRLTELGQSLGLTSADVAAQVRAAFYGVEALAQQEGRNEVTVLVRRPLAERRSEADLERMIIITPDGGGAPLYEVAAIERGRADAGITREDGLRVVNVTANVEPRSETNKVLASVTAEVLPKLKQDFPGLTFSLEGRQAAQRDTMTSLLWTCLMGLAIIYGLLAIPFRSYLQPMVIMMAIPFGFVGAVIGHLIMGYSLSIISVFGIIALSGVVINAGIVMLDYANKARLQGESARRAIWLAGQRRFRPILLTTVTTFAGLSPMIWETSRQAKFLIPMAISLGYGIVFATLIVLFLIPALYLILEDLKSLVNPDREEPREVESDNLPVPGE